MNLERLKSILKGYGCRVLYTKPLSENDNSKNQIYFGGSFDVLNILPFSEIHEVASGEWKQERFHAKLNFFWLSDEGKAVSAPQSKLILYPAYPEVRFSGFLQGCSNPPSNLLNKRIPHRILFLSVTTDGRVLGYVADGESEIAGDFKKIKIVEYTGVFSLLSIGENLDTKSQLIEQLKRINKLGWINSKRLNSGGLVMPCLSSNCGGYTLESELGIVPNGYSEPDYLGWEIKQFGVKNFQKLNSAVITLMTPEPTGGEYIEKGLDFFVRKYGYEDKRGRPDRMNFGGIHKIGAVQSNTGLALKLNGFDTTENKIRNADGQIILENSKGGIAAQWSFASLLSHWNRKHNKACYVPSQNTVDPSKAYRYGQIVFLGEGTSFNFFLSQIASGNIYYDPGIKIENFSGSPKPKKRSQFRIKSVNLNNLYNSYSKTDISK
jgi:hypothetical protein